MACYKCSSNKVKHYKLKFLNRLLIYILTYLCEAESMVVQSDQFSVSLLCHYISRITWNNVEGVSWNFTNTLYWHINLWGSQNWGGVLCPLTFASISRTKKTENQALNRFYGVHLSCCGIMILWPPNDLGGLRHLKLLNNVKFSGKVSQNAERITLVFRKWCKTFKWGLHYIKRVWVNPN